MDTIASFLGNNADHISDGFKGAKSAIGMGKMAYNMHQAGKAFGGDSGFRKETPDEKSIFLGKRVNGDRIKLHRHFREDGSWFGIPCRHDLGEITASPGYVLNCIVMKDHWKDGTNGDAAHPGIAWMGTKCQKAFIIINGLPFRGTDWEVWVWEVPITTMQALIK